MTGNLAIPDLNAYESRIQEIETEIKKSREYQVIENLLSDVGGRKLKDIIETHPELIEYLSLDKLPALRKSLWGSYIKKHESVFNDLLAKYKALSTSINSIPLEDTQWRKALDIFEDRFFVPFKMSIANLKGAIIGESIPQVEFTFDDGTNTKTVNRNTLENLDVLSQGEKRALYLLNIIFDLEKIKASGKECVLIIDDIADSFDYKNKYAIIEYLYELANEEKIFMLIFTHNYDFHRTVSLRLDIKRKNCLVAERHPSNVILEEEHYQKQPFYTWKKNLDEKNILALIPFVRNLCEYGKDRHISGRGEDYLLLTSLLHKKNDTNQLVFADIEPLYIEYLGISGFPTHINKQTNVVNELISVCDRLTPTDVKLENKIILAMAIRHKAEEFMLQEISAYPNNLKWKSRKNQTIKTSQDFINSLNTATNQTRVLFDGYKQFGSEDKVKILNKVNIMTPEHIHINSFMYEPLIDMDVVELLALYAEVKTL